METIHFYYDSCFWPINKHVAIEIFVHLRFTYTGQAASNRDHLWSGTVIPTEGLRRLLNPFHIHSRLENQAMARSPVVKHADLLALSHMLIGLHADLTAGDLYHSHRDKTYQSYV